MREREGLIARIRLIRRVAAAEEKPARPSALNSETESIQALEARIAPLERRVEGLQDSVHRESGRQAKAIAELEARIQPAAMGEALSRDARDRGL
jgi:hypothetical protein